MNSTELFEFSSARNYKEIVRIACWYSLIVSTIILYVYCKWQRQHFLRMVNKFDGPRTLPFIGNLSLFWGSPTGMYFTKYYRIHRTTFEIIFRFIEYFCDFFVTEIFEKLRKLSDDFKGRTFRIWFWDTPYIVLHNPDDIKVRMGAFILAKNFSFIVQLDT